MKINRLVIENFKSIERIELIEPNPFTVFVGPNGSGKSNIFEALEFVNLSRHIPEQAVDLFGGNRSLFNRKSNNPLFEFEVDFGDFSEKESSYFSSERQQKMKVPLFTFDNVTSANQQNRPDYQQFFGYFTRLFVRNGKVKLPYKGDNRIALDADNLEPVLKRILQNYVIKDEIFEWLELFVPGFKTVEVDDRNELHWFEESLKEYFTKDLISDGTYNILALLTAVYQSEEPQFLCIEEPENGLNPKVAREFVNLCRYACEEFGHYIWLNTHSQTLVSVLTPDEVILVDKVNGATQTKQIQGMNLYGLPMDEAWLSNALGGGLPW